MGDQVHTPFVPSTLPPAIKYNTQSVSPPAALYVQPIDRLFLQVFNSAPGVTLIINYKLLLPDGSTSLNSSLFTPTSDRAGNSLFMPLYEGFIYSALIGVASGVVKRGQCFARLVIMRGNAVNVISTQVITSAYITVDDFITWPPGYIEPSFGGRGNFRSITATVPGAGVDIAETVPTGAIWRLVSLRGILTTAVGGPNRQVGFTFDDGATIFFNWVSTVVQAPAVANGYNVAPIPAQMGNATGGIMLSIPPDVFLPAGFRLATATSGIQAGDQWSGIKYLVEEFIQT